MKKTLALLILSLLLFSCNNDDTVKDEEKNKEIENKLPKAVLDDYAIDAKKLYFQEIVQDSTHRNYSNSIMNQAEINKVYKIIEAVYNSNSPQRDTVFDIYHIHTRYCHTYNSISMTVDTTKAEIKNLANNIIPTGEPQLDKLLNRYSFDFVKTSYGFSKYPSLTIYTDKEFNLIPVEKEFILLESVTNISSVQVHKIITGCIGGGDNIKLTRYNDHAKITFSIGRGDCPSGCGYHKFWEFKVKDGKANFVKTYN